MKSATLGIGPGVLFPVYDEAIEPNPAKKPIGRSRFLTAPLWRPSADRIEASNLTAFRRFLRDREGTDFADYPSLHEFSVDRPGAFWSAVWDFTGLIAEERGDTVLADAGKMPGARFFPEARLNFAENLLRRRDDGTAIVFRAEDKVERSLTWRALHDAAAGVAAALRAAGIKPGDRCAAFVPNAPEAVIAMLGTTATGAVWTSCSPDFGVQGVLDRFGQVEPRVLFACDGYYYNGKWISTLARVAEVAEKLPSVERVVLFSLTGEKPDTGGVPKAVAWADFCGGGAAIAI